MMDIITRNGKRIHLVAQFELCDPLTVGDYVRAYCHIHGSDHQRSLSINRTNGWGHCFNATCDATVLVVEWNLTATQHLVNYSYRNLSSLSMPTDHLAPKRIPSATQLVLLLPPKVPPVWQQEERLALLSLDERMRTALAQSKRAQAYLRERRIPLRVAQAAGVGYLPAALLQSPKLREKRDLLQRWTERLLFPLDSLDGKGYIGRSLWRWVPGMDENIHKSILDGARTPRRWIKTNPAGWFGPDLAHLSRSIVLVEGAFDRLALLSAGLKASEVVALAGTTIRLACFPAQVNMVVVALDADAGGKQATERLIEQLEKVDIHTEVCPPPQDRWGKDWSERWRTIGPTSVSPIVKARLALPSLQAHVVGF